MAFIPVENCVQIQLVYLYDGQVVENVLHYAGQTPASENTLTNLANDAFTSWQTTWRTKQPTSLALTKVIATDISSQNGASIEVPHSTANTGTVNEEGMPSNVCYLISLKTANRGRSYRGRLYLPGVCEGAIIVNTIGNAVVAALQDSYTYWDYLSDDGDPWALVVASRYHNKAPRSTGITTNVTSFHVDPTVASQRRRLPGRGR